MSKFYIYDNNSTLPAMLMLWDYMQEGLVEYQYFLGTAAYVLPVASMHFGVFSLHKLAALGLAWVCSLHAELSSLLCEQRICGLMTFTTLTQALGLRSTVPASCRVDTGVATKGCQGISSKQP